MFKRPKKSNIQAGGGGASAREAGRRVDTRMPLKRKLTFTASIDMASGEPKKWYIDLYDVHGQKLHRPHIFTESPDDTEAYKNLGQLRSVCISAVELHPYIECLDVSNLGGLSYQLLPHVYVKDRMRADKEDTMFTRGWKLEVEKTSEITSEMLLRAFSEVQEWNVTNLGGKLACAPRKSKEAASSVLAAATTLEHAQVISNSKVANLEAKTLFTMEPYSDILKHLRTQYVHYGRPSRPVVGVAKGHPSREDWDKFITMAEMSMGAYFTQKQSHMVVCPDDIFNTWCAIVEAVERGEMEGKQPKPSHFRCLCGLENEEVRLVQTKLIQGNILLSKGATNKDKLDMAEWTMQMKQDKVLQEGLLLEFSKVDTSKKFQNWKEVASCYNINSSVNELLQKKCEAWVKTKLQVGKTNLEFPSDVRSYIQWIVSANKEEQVSDDLPWRVSMLNLELEGELFLTRSVSNPLPIGLCILDSTEGSARYMQWTVERLSQLLNGIMAVTGGTRHAQNVFLAFLRFADVARLQDALQTVPGWHRMFIGAIDFVSDAPCNGAIELFSVIIYLSKEGTFDGYSSFTGSEGPILHATLLEIKYDTSQDMDSASFLQEKKSILINQCIKLYCMQDLMMIDAYSNGFVAKHALRERREVLCLVESAQECKKLHSDLLEFAKADSGIRHWAKIFEEPQPVAVVSSFEELVS